MSHSGLGNAHADGDSDDSDHRHKRRKPNPALNGRTKTPSAARAGASPAANPNSFAAKMMAKMGHVEGRGLGATGQGRLAPVDTQLRPQGAGLGAVKEKTKQAKEEEKREATLRGEILEDSEEEEKKRKKMLKEKRIFGATSGGATPSRPKTKYWTATEIAAAADGLEVPNVLKFIIDATGTETKLLTSTSGLMSSYSTMVPSETEAEKIARRARRDLEAFADEWNTLSERKKFFELQESQLASEIVEQHDEIGKLEDITSAVQELQRLSLHISDNDTHNSAWEALTAKLESVQIAHFGDVEGSTLQEIAVATIHPLFKSSLQDWSPLQEPLHLVPYLQRLSHILGIKPRPTNTELALQNGASYTKPPSKSTTAYETMLYTLWLPPVRSAIINDWDPHDPTPLLALITAWQPLLPAFIPTSLLDNLIVQRLTTSLQSWQPHRSSRKHRSSHQDPHTYIFPWLPLLSTYHTSPTSPTGLLFSLRQKIKSLLQTYPLTRHPLTLTPWQPILTTHLPALLTRHLLPRLATHLRTTLLIDPSDQDLEPLTTIQQWTPLLPPPTTAQLLISEFFPKWHQTLHLWLTSNPNYDEIRQWFLWWKEQLPAHPLLDAEWTKGLETISLALDLGPERIGELPPPPPTTMTSSLLNGTTSAPARPEISTPQPAHETTFRDVVEDWCAANNLLFLPLREADPTSGQPLFRITGSASGRGGVVVFLRGDVVWARGGAKARAGGDGAKGGDGKKEGFKPVELGEGLLGRAEGRG